jgi:hypothetical protein
MPGQTLDYFNPAVECRPIEWYVVKRVLLVAAVLVPAEFACARLAYHTIGEITAGTYMMIVLVNVIPLALVVMAPRVAGAWIILLALLVIPYQLLLGVRWWRVHSEAQRMVDYLGAQKSATGNYPADLSGYTFRDGGICEFVRYEGDGLHVWYSVGTPSTSHWYEEGEGWLYYPD